MKLRKYRLDDSVSMVRRRVPFPFGAVEPHVDAFFARIADSAALPIGNICNQHCIYCDTEREPQIYLTREDAFRRIDQMVALGIDRLMLVGGEPTIWRELFATVQYANRKGMGDVILTTNGLMLSYREFVDKLVQSGVTDIQVSCDTFDPVGMRKVSRNRRAEELLNRALDNLVDTRSVRFWLNAVISKVTRPHLEGYLERVLRLSERRGEPIPVVLSHLKPITNAYVHRDLLVEPVTVAAQAILRTLEAGTRAGAHILHKGLAYCVTPGAEPYGWEANIIEYRRHVETAQELPPIQEPWLAKAETCADCRWDPHCSGVYSNYTDRYGWSEYRPVPTDEAAGEESR